MVTEDFSFPTIPDPTPNYVNSTSLWRVPSLVSIQSSHGDADTCVFKADEEEENSFLDCNDDAMKTRMNNDDDVDDEEEKMDMLWENFNDGELLARVSPFEAKKDDEGKLFCGSEFESIKSVQGRSRRRSSTALLSSRRPSLLLILKMLKKLLLLQNSIKVSEGTTH